MGPEMYQYESDELYSPPGSDDEDEPVFPQHNPNTPFGKITLELNMEFETMEHFKAAVQKYNIQIGRQVFYLRNEKKRCRVICYDPDCPWLCYCSRTNYPASFQIKTFVDEHMCPRSNKSKSVSCAWVAEELVPKLRIHPNMLQREAKEWFKVEYDISVNERMMYRAMDKAKDVIEGMEKDQYLRLRDYLNEIIKANPGSRANMGTTPQQEGLPRFRNLYVCLAACKQGFKAGCRPFIVLDETFLKGYFGGQLLTAVGQDANNQLFPIAYGVVDAETRKNWRFFLEELHTDIGDYNENGWVFMSDQQKGLIPALQDVMPCVKHRFYCMHMWRNLNKRWKDKELKGAFWQCAKATTDQEFKDAMANVKRINKQAWEYLDKFEQEQWSRSKFSEWPKVDSLTSNNCESFNSTIVGLRGKSVLTMLEELRFYIMKTMATHKDALIHFNYN